MYLYQYFVFKGINSLDMGVVMQNAPPVIKPQKRISAIEIAGRHGVLHEDTGAYANYTKEAECHVMDRTQIDAVCAWLTGYGELTFSSEPGKVYRAIIKNQIPFHNILLNINDFLVQFDCFPFKYSSNPFNDALTLTAPQAVYNSGTIYSEPIITLYGTGDLTLTVNGTDYGLKNVSGFITVDSERMEVYKGNVNCNNQFQGLEFPRFAVGENAVSWTGNVERVEIEPQWRWL